MTATAPPGWVMRLQQAFVVWVLIGAAWGFAFPDTAGTGKDWIPEMLAAVMLGMGLTLKHNVIMIARSIDSGVLNRG